MLFLNNFEITYPGLKKMKKGILLTGQPYFNTYFLKVELEIINSKTIKYFTTKHV